MKTLVVISDVHYDRSTLRKIEQIMDEADYVVFCGDGFLSLADYLVKYDKKLIAVKGNCDGVSLDSEITFDVEGVNVFVTHGDRYGVKTDLNRLYYRAKELGVDLALFGHTHTAVIENLDGVTLINPGSVALPTNFEKSYAYVVVNDKKIFAKIVKIG